jgi:hypothetical protein
VTPAMESAISKLRNLFVEARMVIMV